MFDIGLGEILLLAVVGLLVFGPEKLPKAAADAGRLIRQLREMATGARRDLAESAGLDMSEAHSALKDIADLHPRRLAASLLEEPATETRPGGSTTGSRPAASRAGSSAAGGGSAPGTPAAPAAFDPDAT